MLLLHIAVAVAVRAVVAAVLWLFKRDEMFI